MGLVAALLAYNGATLGRVPAFLNDDDGGYAAAAHHFWQTGKPGVPGYKDAVALGRDVWAFGRTAAAVQGVFLHFVGVSVFAALLPSFLAGVALVAVTGALGRALWDAQTGWMAALVLAASGKFFEASRWARPDMLLAFFFLCSLWLAASAPALCPARRLFLSGLVMGLAGDVHLNGFLIAPLPLLFWFLLRPGAPRWRATLAFGSAGALGVLFWLALHYWPDPALFRRQILVFGGQTHGLRIVQLGLLGALMQEGRRYLDWFWAARGHRHALEGLCVLGAGLWMMWRGARVGRTLVSVWLAFFLIAALFMSNPFGWYLILVWPLFALWVARGLVVFPMRRLTRIACVALFAAYLLNLALWHWKAQQDVPLQVRVPELRSFIPPDAPVLANGALWFAFWDREYTDEMYLKFRDLEARLFPDSGPNGWMREQKRHGWRYIVASGDLRRFLDPEVPLEDLLSSDVYRTRVALARDTRAFSLARCSVERRISGFAEVILILRVRDEESYVAR